jgi:ATP-dependent Clp protease ATP-binding subunit ClpA
VQTLSLSAVNPQLERFRTRMEKLVVGQPAAIERISDSLSRLLAGVHDPESPLLTMMFMGPTGVGKTETVRALAETIFGSKRAFTRVSCQEYSAHYNVSKLLGSPPGYVGGEIRPLLAQENLDRHHHKALEMQSGLISEPDSPLARLFPLESEQHPSIILFDEIEKAHPKVWDLLLGILEDGTVMLGNNEEADFRKSIIVLTTNVGSEAMCQHLAQNRIGFAAGRSAAALDRDVAQAALREAKKVFPIEFLNRFDDIISYTTLKEPDLFRILDNLLGLVRQRCMRCAEPFLLEVTQRAQEHLVREGTDLQYGARPLKRLVEKEIVTKISHLVGSEQISQGDLVVVDHLEGGLVFQKVPQGAEWDEAPIGPEPSARWAREDLGVRDCGGERELIANEGGAAA